MEHPIRVFRTLEAAAAAEREELWRLTPAERMAIARALQLRVYGADTPDVRESERAKRK
jgi:hypothetical protein